MDPMQYELDATRVEDMTLLHDKLNEGLTNERLQRIQQNIMTLSEPELNQQAIRLELAVHKLTS